MVVVIGGHSKNVGKTTLAVQILSAFAALDWTALKVTQHHAVCANGGHAPCDCVNAEHTAAITEEAHPGRSTDTARMLSAGARRAFWVRAAPGRLGDAVPRIRQEVDRATHTLVESTSILRHLQPELYLSVLDPAITDFKPSSLRYLDRAHAVFLPEGRGLATNNWLGVQTAILARKPQFTLGPDGWSREAQHWFQQRLDQRISGRADEKTSP